MGWGRGNKVSEGNEEVGVLTAKQRRTENCVLTCMSTLNACTWFFFYIYLLVLGISDFSRLTAIGFKYTKDEDIFIVQIWTCILFLNSLHVSNYCLLCDLRSLSRTSCFCAYVCGFLTSLHTVVLLCVYIFIKCNEFGLIWVYIVIE